ncbi:MAG: hypothetical protein MUO77_05100 [Anaerolineales bacterium]|nr:hypothetical protein [Anaerolineales bacterium]
MTDKTGTMKKNRPSKGQRTYTRRLKQAAHKDGAVYVSRKARRASTKITEE